MEDNNKSSKNDRLLRIMSAYKSAAEGRAKQREAENKKRQEQTSHLTEADGTEVFLSDGIMSHFESEDAPIQSEIMSAHFSDSGEKPTVKKEKKKLPKGVKGAVKAFFAALRAGSFAIKLVLYILAVLVISAYTSYYAISVANDIFALVKEDISYTVTIDENTDINGIATELEKNGIIKYADIFKLYLTTQLDDENKDDEDRENKLFYRGEHTVSSTMNYSQLYTALASNNKVREIVRVTIPEGVTTDQLIDILVDAGVGTREKYVDAINNYPYKHEFVKILDASGWSESRTYRLDGYLFPDTYEFYNDSAEYLVINKLLNTFNLRIWKDYEKEYKASIEELYPDMSFDDIVNLAAMVEREGSAAQEYEYIAFVFLNRLNSPETFPKLESDATINYILSLSGEHHEDLTKEDLELQNPYNTYLNDGLPPGAICNPGLDALMATMFPTKPIDAYGNEINAYYFVSSKLGNTYYARSYAAHQANIAKVKKENEEYDAQHAAEH